MKPLIGGLALSLALALAACGDPSGGGGAAAVEASENAPKIAPWGYPLDALDRSIDPGDDFFLYANGGWLERTEIPSDRSGTGFSVEIRERINARLVEIVERLQATRPLRGSNGQKIRDLYESFMDEGRIEILGLDPFQDDLAQLRAIETHEDVARAMADPGLGIGGIFAIYVGIDTKSPRAHTVWAAQNGLSLPDRIYYLRDGPRLDATREAFVTYIETVLGLLGEGEAELRARDV
ncbi:MAG: M13 family metallopeptidase N-terminal domain-containing protein, partial [Pseudomonadota bacterium]